MRQWRILELEEEQWGDESLYARGVEQRKTRILKFINEYQPSQKNTFRQKVKTVRILKFHPIMVKRIRIKLHVSQAAFAHMIGVSVDTLQNWEQGRRKPQGPALALLKVAGS